MKFQANPAKSRARRRRTHWIMGACGAGVATAAVAVGVWFVGAKLPTAAPATTSGGGGAGLISYDEAAKNGNLPTKTEEEIIADLNRIVEEGMFNISIASKITFNKADSEGVASIENIEANPYAMQVTITRDDTGEAVYTSGAIAPGQYIEKIKLDTALGKGTYAATAVFAALDPETLENQGQAAAKIELEIKG